MNGPVLTTKSRLLRDLHAHCDTQTPEQRAEMGRALMNWTEEQERKRPLLRISIRKGEKPLLVIDGTGDEAHLWLFDPHQNVFFCYQREHGHTPPKAYQCNNESKWVFISIEPESKWQPVVAPEMVRLLNEMKAVVNTWLEDVEAGRI